MNKISRLILSAFFLLTLAVNSFASVPLTRIRNFVNDASNNVPITASYMDAELNQLVAGFNNTMVVQPTSPSSPFEGETWYNTTLHIVEEYRNNEWVTIGAVHISATQMSNPQAGDLWYNTSTKVMQLYNGSTFVSLTSNTFSGNVGIGTTLPVGGLDVEGTLTPTIFYGLVSGNVGIGTTVPSARLEIEGGNVGIGTISVSGTQLDVVGTVQAGSFTGQNGHGILVPPINTGSYTINTAYGPTLTDLSVGASETSCGASQNLVCILGPSSPSYVWTQGGGSGGVSLEVGCSMIVPKGFYWQVNDNCVGSNAVVALPSGS